MARRTRFSSKNHSFTGQTARAPRSYVAGGWQNDDFRESENFIENDAFTPLVEKSHSDSSGSFRLSHLIVLLLTGLLFISNAVAWRVVGNSLAWMLLAGAFLTSLLLTVCITWRLFKRGWRKFLAVFLAFTLSPTVYLGANVYSAVYDSTIDAALETKMPARPHFVFHMRSGDKLTLTFDESERFVGPEELWNSHLSRAFIYLEDERLLTRYTGPLDPEAIGRAVKENLIHFEVVEGGSGIEIQTGKLITGFKTEGFLAKGTQALIAFRLDQLFPAPQEKLCLYANIVVLVGEKRGVGFAAADLFGVSDLRKLTPAQAALIAAMLKNPTIFDPRRNPQKVLERRNIALDKMLEHNALSKAEYDKAKAEPIKVLPRIKTRELYVSAASELHALEKIQKTRKEETK